MKRAALVTFIIVATGAAVCAVQPDAEPARDAAMRWLQLVDAGRYEEAASQGSTEVRSFEQWLNHFKSQRAQLGRLSRRQFIELKRAAIISGVPEVRRYNILRFKSSFENAPPLIEEIVLSKVGCCWEIFGYSIAKSDK